MRSSADFSSTVRFGRRIGRGNLVVHALTTLGAADKPSLVGFVVGKTVGGSVVRHRVSRRLRAAMAPRLDLLPAGSATVIRALPPAATASSAELAADVEAALQRLVGDAR